MCSVINACTPTLHIHFLDKCHSSCPASGPAAQLGRLGFVLHKKARAFLLFIHLAWPEMKLLLLSPHNSKCISITEVCNLGLLHIFSFALCPYRRKKYTKLILKYPFNASDWMNWGCFFFYLRANWKLAEVLEETFLGLSEGLVPAVGE